MQHGWCVWATDDLVAVESCPARQVQEAVAGKQDCTARTQAAESLIVQLLLTEKPLHCLCTASSRWQQQGDVQGNLQALLQVVSALRVDVRLCQVFWEILVCTGRPGISVEV